MDRLAPVLETDVDLMEVSKTLRDAFEKGYKKGFALGFEQGFALRQLLVRRIGRELTESEKQALTARMAGNRDAADLVMDGAFSLEGEPLAAWLLDLERP